CRPPGLLPNRPLRLLGNLRARREMIDHSLFSAACHRIAPTRSASINLHIPIPIFPVHSPLQDMNEPLYAGHRTHLTRQTHIRRSDAANPLWTGADDFPIRQDINFTENAKDSTPRSPGVT